MAFAWLTSTFNNIFGTEASPEPHYLPELDASSSGGELQPGGEIPAADRWPGLPPTCPTVHSAWIHNKAMAKSKGKPWNCASPGGNTTVDGDKAHPSGSDLYQMSTSRRHGQKNLYLRGMASAEVQATSGSEFLRGNAGIGVYTRAEDTMYGARTRESNWLRPTGKTDSCDCFMFSLILK
jgi:hypothetical protein